MDSHLNPSPHEERKPQELKKENHSLSKRTTQRTKKENQCFLCFLHVEPPPPPHRSPEQKEFSPCPLLPPLGLCRPLLAQTFTTPHTETHRHRGRRSCAWSLETYWSRREPRSKGYGLDCCLV